MEKQNKNIKTEIKDYLQLVGLALLSGLLVYHVNYGCARVFAGSDDNDDARDTVARVDTVRAAAHKIVAPAKAR